MPTYRAWTALLFLAASASAAPARHITLRTDDGWTLAADYRPPRRGGTVLILAHGVGSSKSEWTVLADTLSRRGVGTLAVDLRGHGDSRKGPHGNRGYEDFDATGEWPKAAGDLLAAGKWLRGRGLTPGRIAFGGASIGANLAAAAAADDHSRTFLLLLSPGVDYHGVALRLPADDKILIGAAPADVDADRTREAAARFTNVQTFSAPTGHGVQMFEDPATLARVAAWIERASAARR